MRFFRLIPPYNILRYNASATCAPSAHIPTLCTRTMSAPPAILATTAATLAASRSNAGLPPMSFPRKPLRLAPSNRGACLQGKEKCTRKEKHGRRSTGACLGAWLPRMHRMGVFRIPMCSQPHSGINPICVMTLTASHGVELHPMTGRSADKQIHSCTKLL